MPDEKKQISIPKMLPPSLRSHKRYIVFEIISEKPIDYGDFVNAVWESMLEFLGEDQTAESEMWLIQNLYNDKTQRGVIKCRHDFVERIRTSISLIQVIGETRAAIRIIGVTGTIKSAKTRYFEESNEGLKRFSEGEP